MTWSRSPALEVGAFEVAPDALVAPVANKNMEIKASLRNIRTPHRDRE
jgi:hypothetical protein